MLLGPRHAGVTLGDNGYMWRDTFGGGSMDGFEVPVADTTGAGDAFHGAFALMLGEQRAISDCARLANGVAAMKCRRLGARAGLPTRDELEMFLSANSQQASCCVLARGGWVPVIGGKFFAARGLRHARRALHEKREQRAATGSAEMIASLWHMPNGDLNDRKVR